MFASDHNPYAAPRLHQDSAIRIGKLDLTLRPICVKRGWLTRTIVLTGDIDATVRYLGWTAGESVYVNDILVGKCLKFYLTAVAPRIDFSIESQGLIYSASILARASYFQLFRLTKFKLIVDDQLVYEE